jgi:hypothetical protein
MSAAVKGWIYAAICVLVAGNGMLQVKLTQRAQQQTDEAVAKLGEAQNRVSQYRAWAGDAQQQAAYANAAAKHLEEIAEASQEQTKASLALANAAVVRLKTINAGAQQLMDVAYRYQQLYCGTVEGRSNPGCTGAAK